MRIRFFSFFIFIFLNFSLIAQDNLLRPGLAIAHSSPISQLEFSDDGRFIVSCAEKDSRLLLWQVESGRVFTYSHKLSEYLTDTDSKKISSVEVSHSGRFVYINDQILWDTKTDKYRTDLGSLNRFLGEQMIWTEEGIYDPSSDRIISSRGQSVLDIVAHAGKVYGVTELGVDRSSKGNGTTIRIINIENDNILWELSNVDRRVMDDYKYTDKDVIIGFDSDTPVLYLNLAQGYFDGRPGFLNVPVDDETGLVQASFDFDRMSLKPFEGEIPLKKRAATLSKTSMKDKLQQFGFDLELLSNEALAFSKKNLLLASGLSDGNILVWDLRTQKVKRSLERKSAPGVAFFANESSIHHFYGTPFNGVGEGVVQINQINSSGYPNSNRLAKWDIQQNKVGIHDYRTSVANLVNNGAISISDPSIRELALDILPDNRMRYSSRDENLSFESRFEDSNLAHFVSDTDGERKLKLKEVDDYAPVVHFTSRGSRIYHSNKNNKIVEFDLVTESYFGELGSHDDQIISISISPDERWLISSSLDGTSKIFDLVLEEEVGKITFVGSRDWVIITPSGHFDGTAEGIRQMHYIYNHDEMVSFDQLKSEFMIPGLIRQVFGKAESNVDLTSNDFKFGLYPGLEAEIFEDRLEYQVFERNGGIGKLSMWINNRLVEKDININRSKNRLFIDLGNYNQFFINNFSNSITLRAYGEDEKVPGPALKMNYNLGKVDPDGSNPMDNLRNMVGKVRVFGLFVGTNNYKEPSLSLKFADQDAEAMRNAIELSASKMWGSNMLNLNLLSTDILISDISPSKRNIKRIFEEDLVISRPTDILFVYFSGLRFTRFDEETGQHQWYYLTKDVSNFDINDREMRKRYTISSAEVESWLNNIPSMNQVMVLDLCTASSGMLNSPDHEESTALDGEIMQRIHRSSGVNILASNARDKDSFESSKHGQAMLTYGLLTGMQKVSGMEEHYVENDYILQYAKDQLPKLSERNSGIPPAIKVGSGNFDWGIVDKSIMIQSGAKKPVFIKSNFQSKDLFLDSLEIGKKLDRYLSSESDKGSDYLFAGVDEQKGGFQIIGRYFYSPGKVNLNVKIFRGKEFLGRFNISGANPQNLDGLCKEIVAKALLLLPEL